MKNLLDKNNEELPGLLGKKKQELMHFRFLVRQGQVKDNKKGQRLKKEIAQILTKLNQK